MNISIERLQQIENERAQTFTDPSFGEWFKQLNVSRLCTRTEGRDRARDLMNQWQEGKQESIFQLLTK